MNTILTVGSHPFLPFTWWNILVANLMLNMFVKSLYKPWMNVVLNKKLSKYFILFLFIYLFFTKPFQ